MKGHQNYLFVQFKYNIFILMCFFKAFFQIELEPDQLLNNLNFNNSMYQDKTQ